MRFLCHILITGNGGFATLGQVGIVLNERVKARQMTGRICRVLRPFGFRLQPFDARKELSYAVAGGQIILVQRREQLRLIADGTEQIVTIVVTVGPFHQKRRIVGSLHDGQFPGVRHGFLTIVASQVLSMLVELSVLGIDMSQDGLTDSLKSHILCLLFACGQPLHERLQRVGRHVAGRLPVFQQCLQQLAILCLALGRCDDLAEHLALCLRQVILLGLLHLIP